MFAKETEKKIDEIIQAEYENAKEKWGDRYASLHEGFAVLKEEVWESKKAMRAMKRNCKSLFFFIAANARMDAKTTEIGWCLENARKLAMEACQVAAVCKKMLDGVVR